MTPTRRRWSRSVAAVAVLALAATPMVAASAADSDNAGLAPLLQVGTPGSIPGEYIVVLERKAASDSVEQVAAAARAAGGTVSVSYHTVVKGFAATLSDEALAVVRANPAVAFIEADGVVTANVEPSDEQPDPPWGLDRVDQRDLPLDQTYEYDHTGAGVSAFVIDTGIRLTHEEFEGRAISGYDFVRDDDDATDCHGHGTHVAGTIGGKTYGIAKEATLVGMRVLNCAGRGNWSRVVAAVDWAVEHREGPAVANLSLGGPKRHVFDMAIHNAVDSGLTVVVSAGNSAQDACLQSPARAPRAITVAATSSTDTRAGFSNYGPCVDIFAPGVSVLSAWVTSDTATATLSGTSMSSPHVAGVAALYLEQNPDAIPKKVRRSLVLQASMDKVISPGEGSPNRLLWSKIAPPGQS